MPGLTSTITIVNQSGKVVKTSKNLVGVFKEAKAAYREKKAEIRALRRDGAEKALQPGQRLEGLDLNDNDDTASQASSRRSSRSRRGDGEHRIRRKPVRRPADRPLMERGYTDSYYADDLRQTARSNRPSPLRQDSGYSPPRETSPRAGELTRRHTTDLNRLSISSSRRPATPTRSASLDDIDMDLAYGELPPALPERKYDTEIELRQKMTGLQRMLDELNCLQHSAAATIENLQKNPEALAAVALTLGEISTLATKLAPGALTSLKTSFPAILALLASPQFAIAVGVGVGVTVIALGGYKIVKKIQAKKAEKAMLEAGASQQQQPPPPGRAVYIEANGGAESEVEELRELNSIERWRRGIADVEEGSLGTSVEGEFITELGARTLIEEGRLAEGDLKSSPGRKGKKDKEGKDKNKKKKDSRSKAGSEAGSSRMSSKSRTPDGKKEDNKKKEKEPSGLRMLFKTHA